MVKYVLLTIIALPLGLQQQLQRWKELMAWSLPLQLLMVLNLPLLLGMFVG